MAHIRRHVRCARFRSMVLFFLIFASISPGSAIAELSIQTPSVQQALAESGLASPSDIRVAAPAPAALAAAFVAAGASECFRLSSSRRFSASLLQKFYVNQRRTRRV